MGKKYLVLIICVFILSACKPATSAKDMESIRGAIAKDYSSDVSEIKVLGEGLSDMTDYNLYCVVGQRGGDQTTRLAFLVDNYFGYWSALLAYDAEEWSVYGCADYTENLGYRICYVRGCSK